MEKESGKMWWVYSKNKTNKKEEIFRDEQKVNQRAESQRSLRDVARATFG